MRENRPTRREFVAAVGLAGLAGGGLVAGAQDGTTTTEQGTTAGEDGPTTIILGGESSHWFGLAPPPIHGEENPTLALQAGRRYELVWINLDGEEHELIVEDANGQELEASESARRAGQTVRMTFTASEEMAEYYCEYHPEAMRGDVRLGGGFETTTPANGNATAGNATANDTTAGNATDGNASDGGGGY